MKKRYVQPMVRNRAIGAESIMQYSTPGLYGRTPNKDTKDNSYAKPMNAWDSCWE